jgi:hypothetical protein
MVTILKISPVTMFIFCMRLMYHLGINLLFIKPNAFSFSFVILICSATSNLSDSCIGSTLPVDDLIFYFDGKGNLKEAFTQILGNNFYPGK